MRKLVFLLFAWCVANTALAQLSGNGFYRVQNNNTGRYLTFITKEVIKAADGMDVDLSQAMISKKDFENDVVKDPGSIVYISSVSGGYDLQSQGIDSYSLMGIPLVVTPTNGGYICSGTMSASGASVTKTLYDNGSPNLPEGFLTTSNTGNGVWAIKPVSVSSSNYFGLLPQQYDGEYWTSLMASFGFEGNPKNVEVYAVTSVHSEGVAVVSKIQGAVPPGTPVIIKCATSSSYDNRLDLKLTTNTTVSKNLLKGVYLARTQSYDPSTMRVLGKGKDGKKAFVTARNLNYVNRNEAFLMVPKGYPEELTIMTEEEWNSDVPVTITINNASRVYGDPNPDFTYTVSPAGALKGTPVFVCNATSTTPVGTGTSEYEIWLKSSSIANSTVTVNKGMLTVTKAPLTVVPYDETRMVGFPNPEFRLNYYGFKNGDTEDVLITKPVASCPSLQEKVGKYPIVVSGGEAKNYELVYEQGTLELLPPSVRPANIIREYGDDNPPFTYTPEGILKAEPLYSCSADKTSEVGSYPIYITKVSSADAGIDYSQPGMLTVQKAPLRVNFSESVYRMNAGDDLPEFKLVYTGFENGEDESVLIEPVKVTVQGNTSDVGTRCRVRMIGGEAKNYEIVRGDEVFLYIDPAKPVDPVTVTATSFERYYGDANPKFTYTSKGAELKGEPAITCEATATSAPGQYAIKISKGGVTNKKDTYVDGVLTILPAPLTITAGNFTRKQGEENPDFTQGLTYSGFKLNETADVLTVKPTVTCAADKDSEPGEYDVVVSGAESANYSINYVNGKLIVGEADELIVVAESFTREYGEANPEFKYNVSGADAEGTPEVTCVATATSPVGTYDIVVAKGTLTNYKTRFTNGKLTITPATLKVSVGNYEREEGEDNPQFAITYEGWKNGENESVLLVKPTATTEAGKDAKTGKYAITVSGGLAENYVLEYTNGELEVKIPSGIMAVFAKGQSVDIYTTTGVLVKKGATTLKGLSRGVYLVGGKKVVIK